MKFCSCLIIVTKLVNIDFWLNKVVCSFAFFLVKRVCFLSLKLIEESCRRYLTLLVNALSRCALFLAAESPFFDANLVHRFCVATLVECEKAQMIERLPTSG